MMNFCFFVTFPFKGRVGGFCPLFEAEAFSAFIGGICVAMDEDPGVSKVSDVDIHFSEADFVGFTVTLLDSVSSVQLMQHLVRLEPWKTATSL